MDVNPGELNKRIRIFQPSAKQDFNGYPTGSPGVKYACWAKFSRMSGTEAVRANADFANVKARFLIRHTNTAITNDMFIEYADSVYEIQYINDYGDSNRYIEIIAERVESECGTP